MSILQFYPFLNALPIKKDGPIISMDTQNVLFNALCRLRQELTQVNDNITAINYLLELGGVKAEPEGSGGA